MPLRDHFRPPLDDRTSWEEFYGGWPMEIVRSLADRLPLEYGAAPRVHRCAFVETDLPDTDEYEVRVYDTRRGRRLVAAIEIVSPANKARPEHRRAFVAKCSALLQKRVSVTIVDFVTTRGFNLYADLLDLIGQPQLSPGSEASQYAVVCRYVTNNDHWQFETWEEPLTFGQALPTLPLWLNEDLAVQLDLEESYEETCGVLGIR